MPKLSRYTPLGMLRLTSRPSHAEQIHKAMRRAQGTAYAADGLQDARLYAQAMAIARAKYALEHAGNQQFARKAGDLFPVLEREHDITPRAGATEGERRGEVAARMLLPAGAAQTNIENALADLLGDDFVAYRPTTTSEAVAYPTSIGASPMNLQAPSVVRKRLLLATAITVGLGAPQAVTYTETLSSGTVDTSLLAAVGDVLVVGPGTSTEETVTVSAATTTEPYSLTATFTLPHPPSTLAITMPYPMWSSTKRYSLVVLTASAAADPEKRRKVHDIMRRIARGVSTWAIAGESATRTTGPFTVGGGRLGITTIGTVSV